ncbi:MAG: hypothetical protein K2X39_03920, partial [Silvanigrellaceae bacterium]|nr:hypothetical protein [Silvanigrellaceae bacterium]
PAHGIFLPLIRPEPPVLETFLEEVDETNGSSSSSSSSTQRTPLATSSMAEESSRKRNYAQYEADGGEQIARAAPQGQPFRELLLSYLRRIDSGQLNPTTFDYGLLIETLKFIIQNHEGSSTQRTLASLVLSRLFYQNGVLDSRFLDIHGIESQQLSPIQIRLALSDLFRRIIANYSLHFRQASPFDSTFVEIAAYAINSQYIRFEEIYSLGFPLPLIDDLKKLTPAFQTHSQKSPYQQGIAFTHKKQIEQRKKIDSISFSAQTNELLIALLKLHLEKGANDNLYLKNTNITKIEMTIYEPLKDEVIEFIKNHFPHCKTLVFKTEDYNQVIQHLITNKALGFLSELSQLEILTIPYSNKLSEGRIVRLIKSLTNLISLSLHGHKNLSKTTFQALQKLINLKELILSKTPLDNNDLQYLCSLPLTSLVIDNTSVTFEGLHFLASSSNLKNTLLHLSLNGINLGKDSMGVIYIAVLTKLETLSISETNITFPGLKILAQNLHNLYYLNLDFCRELLLDLPFYAFPYFPSLKELSIKE